MVFTREFSWEFEGEHCDQEEWFFLVRVETFTPSSNDWTDAETATIRGTRWWLIDELRTTDQEIFPEALADQLERLLCA